MHKVLLECWVVPSVLGKPVHHLTELNVVDIQTSSKLNGKLLVDHLKFQTIH